MIQLQNSDLIQTFRQDVMVLARKKFDNCDLQERILAAVANVLENYHGGSIMLDSRCPIFTKHEEQETYTKVGEAVNDFFEEYCTQKGIEVLFLE